MSASRFVAMLVTLSLLSMTVIEASKNLRSTEDQVPSGSSSGSAAFSGDYYDTTQDATPSASTDSSVVHTESRPQDNREQVHGVKAWAQCGGLYYLGDTHCTQYTFCKQISNFISVCFPESRPTEQVIRLEL